MTIPITSYQIGTTQIQYQNQVTENVPDIDFNSNIDVTENVPDIDFNSNINVTENIPDIDFNSNIDVPDNMNIDVNTNNEIPYNDNQFDYCPNDIPNNSINNISISDNSINNNNNILSVETNINPITHKYNILDLFWLLNPNSNKETNKIDFVTISYNLDFGNLKVNCYNILPGAIQDNVIFLQSMKLLVSGTIYSGSAFKLLNNSQDIQFNCIEQLIQNTNESWQKERPIVQLEKTNEYILLNITNKTTNQIYFYKFLGWQRKAFEHALKVTYTNGLNLRSNIL